MNQIKLTEKHIQGFIAADDEMAKLYGANVDNSDAKVRAHLADLGGAVLPGSPADFGKLLMQEVDKWSKVVKASGAKPE